MAQLNITASQLAVIKQNIQQRYLKIELLNTNFQVVDSLEGVGINGSISIDSNSDMRRSATLKFIVKDSSFEVSPEGKVWLDKYIRLYLGIYSIEEEQVIYTKLGVFVIDAPSYEYDAVNNSIQMSLLDLMCKLSGLRNGYLPGLPVTIKAEENIRKAMIDTLKLGGFTKYVCSDTGALPNDLSFNQGSTIYTILSGLRDIYPNYEIYFDVDGVFHYEPIPTGASEAVQIDDTLWDDIVIGENNDVDFQNVKNSIEVYGRMHEPDFYCDNPTILDINTSLVYILCPIASTPTDYLDSIFGFMLKANTKIKSTGVIFVIFYQTGTDYHLGVGGVLFSENNSYMKSITASEDTYFCVKPYTLETETLTASGVKWVGHLQSYALAEDTNPDSPFYVNSSIGRIRLPLFGGDYDNCFTDELAMQRAKYELYLHTRLQDAITLTCLPVPWLDVGVLVEYTLKRNNEKRQYIIQSISYGFDVDDTMSVTMHRYYPNYTII